MGFWGEKGGEKKCAEPGIGNRNDSEKDTVLDKSNR